MIEWLFVATLYNPCMYYHHEKKILCLVHGDDFVSTADPEDLTCQKKGRLSKRFGLKTKRFGLNAEDGEVKEERISEHNY